MIRFQNLSKIYPGQSIAVDGISLRIADPEFVSITGKSGAGKTTLIRLLLGEEHPTKGRVFFKDQDVHKISKRLLPKYRRNFGIVFQDYKLLDQKTVYENVAYALEVMGESEEEIAENVPQALEIVDMFNRVDAFPSELSGGEKQRVAIARSIIHRPDVLIADEPTGNLDPYHTWEIVKLLMKIHELGTTVILATHDKEVINFLKKRVISLDGGKVVRDEEEGRYIL